MLHWINHAQGRSQDFYKKGVTLYQSEGTHHGQGIIMAFAPPVVGCLLKKGYKRGAHGHPGTPLATPLM